MEYVVYKRFRGKSIGGVVNIPSLSICQTRLFAEVGDVIIYEGLPVCTTRSKTCYEHLASNYDGNGLLRGRLISEIKKRLSRDNKNQKAAVEKICDDETCLRYKRKENPEVWIWNHLFYNAPIQDLKYIANLIGIKTK